MTVLKIDDKWSVEYDPDSNDRPCVWLHYGKPHSEFDENNAVTAMFYALLEARTRPSGDSAGRAFDHGVLVESIVRQAVLGAINSGAETVTLSTSDMRDFISLTASHIEALTDERDRSKDKT